MWVSIASGLSDWFACSLKVFFGVLWSNLSCMECLPKTQAGSGRGCITGMTEQALGWCITGVAPGPLVGGIGHAECLIVLADDVRVHSRPDFCARNGRDVDRWTCFSILSSTTRTGMSIHHSLYHKCTRRARLACRERGQRGRAAPDPYFTMSPSGRARAWVYHD